MFIAFDARAARRRAVLLLRNAALAGTALTALYALPVSAAPLCGADAADGAVLNCSGTITNTGLNTGSHNDVTVNVGTDTTWGYENSLIKNTGGSNFQLNIETGASLTTSTGPLISLSGGSGKIVIGGSLSNQMMSSGTLISLQGDETNHYEVIIKPEASFTAYNSGLYLHSTARVTVEADSIGRTYNLQAEGTKDTFRLSKDMPDYTSWGFNLSNYIKADDTGFETFEFAKGNWTVDRNTGGPKRDLRVTGGRLTINGNHNADVYVNGGFFGGSSGFGNGITGNLIATGGTVKTISLLTVGGNVEFQSGSTYSPAVGSFFVGKLAAEGTVTIGSGTTLLISPSFGFAPGSFSILTAANGITGQFSTVTLEGGETLSATTNYTTNELTVTLGSGGGGDGGGHSDNGGKLVPAATTTSGTSAASVLDNARGNPVMTNMIAVLDALPAQQKAASLTSLSGQTTTTMAAMPTASASSVVSTVLNHNAAKPGATAPVRFGGSSDSADAGGRTGISTGEKAPANDHGAWASVLGGFGSVDTKKGVAGSDTKTGGFAGGLDFSLEPERLTAGVSFGYVGSRTDIDNNGGSANAKAGFLGLYGRLEDWGIRLDGTLMGGRHYGEQSRNVMIGTATSTAEGENDGWSLGAGLQVSAPFQLARDGDFDAVLRPFAGVTTQRYWQGEFTETGAGTANLHYGSFKRDSFVSRLGAAWEFDIQAGKETRLAPIVSLGWAHQFAGNAPRMDAAFALLPDSRFSITGAEMARDSLEIGLGLDVIDLGQGLTFTIGYGGSLAQDAQDHTFSGRAKMAL